jgi:hypothetical protein
MYALAHQIMRSSRFCVSSTVANHAVTAGVQEKGPQDTFFCIGDQGLFKKLKSLAALRHALNSSPNSGVTQTASQTIEGVE